MPPEISQALNTNVAIGLIVFFCASAWAIGVYFAPAVKDWILSRAAMHRAQEALALKLATNTETTAKALEEIHEQVVVKGCPARVQSIQPLSPAPATH